MEKHVTPKPVPSVIPKIGVGAKVILIDIITHALEVFKTPIIVSKDTPIVERLRSQPVPLVEPIDTTCEQHVDDLIAGVKQIVIGD